MVILATLHVQPMQSIWIALKACWRHPLPQASRSMKEL